MMKRETDKRLWQFPQAEKYLSTFLPRLQEKRTQSYTTIVFSLVTLSFFGFFAISPTLSTIADLQKQISDQQFVDQQLKQKITNLSNLQITYHQIQNQLPILYSAIPQNPNVTTLVGQLQTLAQKDQVTLLSVQTLPVDVSQTVTPYNSFAFTLNITGSYENMKTFLTDIAGFNRIITLEAIALTQNTHETDAYSLSLRGDAYFKAQ